MINLFREVFGHDATINNAPAMLVTHDTVSIGSARMARASNEVASAAIFQKGAHTASLQVRAMLFTQWSLMCVLVLATTVQMWCVW